MIYLIIYTRKKSKKSVVLKAFKKLEDAKGVLQFMCEKRFKIKEIELI